MKLKLRGKLTLSITAAFLITYIVIAGYIIINTQQKAIDDAKHIAKQYALRNANESKALLMRDLGVASAMVADIKEYFDTSDSIRSEAILRLLTGIATHDERYHSSWVSIELNAIDPYWGKNHGRKRYTVYRNKDFVVDSLNLDQDNAGSLYHTLKLSKKEEITDPYYFSEYSSIKQDDVFGTSVCVPIIVNGSFAGIAGMDLSLNNFDFITDIKPYESATTFLVSNNGTIVAHENKDIIGKNIEEALAIGQEGLSQSISKGRFSSFTSQINQEEAYITFAPVPLGSSDHPWALGTIVPMENMTKATDRVLYYSLAMSLAGLLILFLLVRFIAGRIIKPILSTSNLLKELSEGKVNKEKKLSIDRDDELGEMAGSLNVLVDSLEQKVAFATDIKENKLDSDIGEISKEDALGVALQQMRESLKKNNEQNRIRNWFTQGVAEFSDVLRYNNDDTGQFYFTIIQNLVKYLKANQGGIFLLNEAEEGEKHLELMGAYAFERRKYIEKKIEIGQGIIGQCVLEADTIYLEEIPADYIRITSGLGDAPPRSILIVPLKLNNDVMGVVELASFHPFSKHEIEFVEKVGESIASFIFSYNITVRTKKLLEESQEQAEQMRAQEEEMRQNIEELEATQEAMHRVHTDSLRNEALLKAIMEGTDDAILAIDQDYTVVALNPRMQQHITGLNTGSYLLQKLEGNQAQWEAQFQKVFAGQKQFFSNEKGDSYHLHPVANDKGLVEFCLLISRKAEAALQEG
ncbi:cache domain-containing protein [Nafulsella turpanensis]|uniref:cache domain-containing protein n=1 Tax=Nafulsella turpanensis TaxID=1265690 RepID=UPI00034BBE1F|nr:GAF domain-containing protein [Nafulsella turpanensis]